MQEGTTGWVHARMRAMARAAIHVAWQCGQCGHTHWAAHGRVQVPTGTATRAARARQQGSRAEHNIDLDRGPTVSPPLAAALPNSAITLTLADAPRAPSRSPEDATASCIFSMEAR
jgi:hypothetical protein